MTFVVGDGALEHHGVKGMHWGQHKSTSSTGRAESRSRHESRIRQINRLTTKAELASTKKQKADLVSKVNAIAKEGKASGDVTNGFSLSKGQGVVAFLLTGGLGNVALTAANKQTQKNELAVLDTFANLKVSDLRDD